MISLYLLKIWILGIFDSFPFWSNIVLSEKLLRKKRLALHYAYLRGGGRGFTPENFEKIISR